MVTYVLASITNVLLLVDLLMARKVHIVGKVDVVKIYNHDDKVFVIVQAVDP